MMEHHQARFFERKKCLTLGKIENKPEISRANIDKRNSKNYQNWPLDGKCSNKSEFAQERIITVNFSFDFFYT